jgi:chromosome segregation ATPase
MASFDDFSKDQLISHIHKLQSDFNEFSYQSSQVEDLLQQQLDVCERELTEKNSLIENMETQFQNIICFQSKITTLETENDLLESTIRMLQSQLELSNDQQNELIEKIAFLENEIELYKDSLQKKNDEEFEKFYEKKWYQLENEYKKQINDLKLQLNEHLNLSNNQNIERNETQQQEIDNLKYNQQILIKKLRKIEKEKQILTIKLRKLQNKYIKFHKITTLFKLKQHKPIRAYTTPALNPLA